MICESWLAATADRWNLMKSPPPRAKTTYPKDINLVRAKLGFKFAAVIIEVVEYNVYSSLFLQSF